jgi:hypothetical protein
MRSRLAGLVSIALALVLAPAPAEAQFGDMLKKAAKKKAAEAVEKKAGGSEAEPEKAAEPAPAKGRAAAAKGPYNSWVLEITPEILDRAAVAIRTENQVRDSLAAVIRTKPELERKHALCVQEISQDAKMQAFMDKIGDDKATQAEKQKVMTDMNDYMIAKCGQQHENDATRAEEAIQRLPAQRAAAAGSFASTGQYGVVKERIMPFCGGQVESMGEGARVPGDGTGIYWVYSPGEIAALKPRCGEFAGLLKDAA